MSYHFQSAIYNLLFDAVCQLVVNTSTEHHVAEYAPFKCAFLSLVATELIEIIFFEHISNFI